MITAILIDSREPDWVQALKFGGVPTSVCLLDYGDLHAITDDGYILVIERKTPNDFLGSLREERLFPQIARMVEQRQANPNLWPYLVITGEFRLSENGKVYADGRATGWDYSAVMGSILTIQEIGVPIIFCAGDEDFESAVIRLGKRERGSVRVVPPRAVNFLGPQVAILCGFPGFGTQRSTELLKLHPRLADALVDLALDHQRVRDVLGLRANEYLLVAEK